MVTEQFPLPLQLYKDFNAEITFTFCSFLIYSLVPGVWHLVLLGIIHAADIIGTVVITDPTVITSTVAITYTVNIIHTASITSTMTIRLSAIDKYHVAGFQLILLSFINQLPFPILDHKAKV